jgi:hypothetical protein
MNVVEINPPTTGTLSLYFAVTFPLSIVTAWVIMAFQSKYLFKEELSFFKRLGWPVYLLIQMIKEKKDRSARVRDSHTAVELADMGGPPH